MSVWSGCGVNKRGEDSRVVKACESIQMLMSFPGRVVPIQDVQNGMREIIKNLSALVGVDHHEEVGGFTNVFKSET